MPDAPRGPVVVVGESLVDIVVPHQGPPVDAPGGSPLNVAVGLARLGLEAVLLTQLGDDAHGRLVREHVERSGVRLAEDSVVPGRRTSTATAHLDEHNAASYAFDLEWTLPRRVLPADARALHVGSIAAALRPGRDTVVDLVDQAAARGAFVSFDPNARPAFLPRQEQAWRDMSALASRADLVKLSDEDVAVLAAGRTVEEVATELLSGGRTALVVVTEGGGGARAFAEGITARRAAEPVAVVDTVGAGDSFMSALLAVTLEHGLPRDEASAGALLRAAHAAAGITVSRRGADPPTREELPRGWPDL